MLLDIRLTFWNCIAENENKRIICNELESVNVFFQCTNRKM